MKWAIPNLLWTGTFIGLLNLVIVIGAETPNYHRNWHEEELFQTCRDIFQSSTRICDPDHLLDVPSHYALDYDIRGMADADDDDTISMSNSSNSNSNSKNGTTTALNAITIALKELKTNHHLPIDTSSCENQSNNVVRGKPISMAIVIVPSIILPRNERPAHIASLMKYAWDSSHEECECQLNDILLLISLEDGEPMIEIYTSQDLRHILTIGRKNDIIEGMMPSLNRGRYATAIIAAIEDIIRDVDKEQDQDQVSGPKMVFMLLLCVVPFLVGVIKMYVYIHEVNMRRHWLEPSPINIQPIKDDGKPLELMKKFNCTGCMICQLDFEEGFEQKMAIEGGRPITLLQCGHPYHTSCIERWCQAGLTNSHLCPVCKAPILDNDTSNGPSRNGRGLSRNLTSSRNRSISPRSESSTAASLTSLSSFEVAMERYESRRRRRRREHRRRFESQSFIPGRPPLLLSDDVMQPYEVRVQAQSTEASPLISPSSSQNCDYNSRNRRIEAYPALPILHVHSERSGIQFDPTLPYEKRFRAQSIEESPLISPRSESSDYNSIEAYLAPPYFSDRRRSQADPSLPPLPPNRRPRVRRNFMSREQQFNWSEYNEIFPDRPRSSETLEFLDRVQSQSYESAAF